MTRNWRGHRILQYIVQEPLWGPNTRVRWCNPSKTSDQCCPGTLLMDTQCGTSFQKLDTWILESNQYQYNVYVVLTPRSDNQSWIVIYICSNCLLSCKKNNYIKGKFYIIQSHTVYMYILLTYIEKYSCDKCRFSIKNQNRVKLLPLGHV